MKYVTLNQIIEVECDFPLEERQDFLDKLKHNPSLPWPLACQSCEVEFDIAMPLTDYQCPEEGCNEMIVEW